MKAAAPTISLDSSGTPSRDPGDLELTFGAALAATGLSPTGLRKRDAELQPRRTAGGERVYASSRVAALAIARAARKLRAADERRRRRPVAGH